MIKIKALGINKSSIPTKIIQEAKEIICPCLTDFINATRDNSCFPGKLKESDVGGFHKEADRCQQVN